MQCVLVITNIVDRNYEKKGQFMLAESHTRVVILPEA